MKKQQSTTNRRQRESRLLAHALFIADDDETAIGLMALEGIGTFAGKIFLQVSEGFTSRDGNRHQEDTVVPCASGTTGHDLADIVRSMQDVCALPDAHDILGALLRKALPEGAIPASEISMMAEACRRGGTGAQINPFRH
ncbi:hypothetical protein D9M72_316110 [compost metagenome]